MYKSDYFNSLAPINQAHLLERKAEQCFRRQKYDEAISFHQDASRILKDVLGRSISDLEVSDDIVSSLEAQIKHHEKQDCLILLRRAQRERIQKEREKNIKRSIHEPFQDLVNFSTTSIESYDSTDLAVSTSSNSLQNNLLQEHLNKRDEVIKSLGLLVRQQQSQILMLSTKLKEKHDENKLLKETVDSLQRVVGGATVESELHHQNVSGVG